MRALICVVGLGLALPSAARAQTAATAAGRGYVEAMADSAFANVTSQAYGAEVGVSVSPAVQVFVEAGRIRNVATGQISTAAQDVATFVAGLQPASVTYTVRQPAAIVSGGVRYLIPSGSSLQPYVLGGLGVARVTNKVGFLFNGAAAGDELSQYVTIGNDLSGATTSAMVTLGGGVAVPVWQRVIVDLQYRYGRIFANPQRITANRLGVGIGVRF